MKENFVKPGEPAAGVMGSGKEDLGQELDPEIQHATPPFRWKGAADLKREALCRQLQTRFWRLEAAGIGLRWFVGRSGGSNLKARAPPPKKILDF